MQAQWRTRFTEYGIAVLGVILATGVRHLLDPILGDRFPFATLFFAVIFAAWYGGFGPALAATTLGAIASVWVLLPTPDHLKAEGVSIWAGLTLYFTVGVGIALLGGSMRAAQRRSERTRQAESVERKRLQVTLQSIGDAVIVTDRQGRVTLLNTVAQELTSWTQEQATGQSLDAIFRIVNQETRLPIENPALRALREGVVAGLANHTILIGKDGREHPIDDSAALIRDEHGDVRGVVLVFRDVAERRQFEKDNANRLHAARLLASIVESSNDAIISKRLDGIIQTWNVAAQRLFGYSAEQAVGRHISLVIPPDRLAEEDQIIASLKAGQRVDHFETVRLRSDGQPVWVALTISPIKDEVGRVIGASKIVRDITDRKRAEAERQKLVTLVENSTDFIGMCDMQGLPVFVNQAGLDMVGLDGIEQARRTPVRNFFFPEDQAKIMDEFFPSVRKKGHGEIEVRFRHFKTGEARWMAYKVIALTDASGQAVGFATVSQDVTRRRQMEEHLRQLAADLSEAGRRKDEFLATLAHELRNPLAPISNGLQVLKMDGHLSQLSAQARNMMERQIGQLVRLVDDLLDVSRITRNKLELRKEPVSLEAVVNSAVEISRPHVEASSHQLTITVPAEPINLNADPTRLAQVFSNLLNNAAKYTERGGRVWLIAERQADQVVVTVKDTGIGIPHAMLPKVFDMFTQVDGTLERAQGGLGIGLTLVRRLVEMHGGTVEAHSEGSGHGSTFIVRLPVVDEELKSEVSPDQGPLLAVMKHRILVVDDNEDSVESLSILLELMGNEVVAAHDGLQAVEAAMTFKPDVILLDIGLPKLNGYEVCRRIREQPGGKNCMIVAVTGWGQDEDRRLSEEAGFDHHLVKPVAPADLNRFLAEIAFQSR